MVSISETISTGMTIHGICRQMFPLTPCTPNIGMKAIIVVNTPKAATLITSQVPRGAARWAGSPASIRSFTRSPTTIASSVTIPSTRMKANSEIMLIEMSPCGSAIRAPAKAIGIPSATWKASAGRRNSARAMYTRMKPWKPSPNKSLMRPSSSTDSSFQISRSTPFGTWAVFSATNSRTSPATRSVSSSPVRKMLSTIAGWPS